MNPGVPPTSDDRVIAGSLPCIRCGYDLDKRALGSLCPECGNPASLSLESLWLDEAGSIRRLRQGIRVLIVAGLLGPAIFLVSMVIGLLLPMTGGLEEDLVSLAAAALCLGPLLAWRGVHVASEGRPGRARPAQLMVVRGLGAMYTFLFAAPLGLFVMNMRGMDAGSGRLALTLMLAAGEVWCVRNLMVLGHVQSIARVSNMPGITRAVPFFQAYAAGLGVGLLLLVWPIIQNLPPPGWVMQFAYPLLVMATGAWLLAWPVLLGRFALGLRNIGRKIEKDGPIRIVEGVELPAALPTAP